MSLKTRTHVHKYMPAHTYTCMYIMIVTFMCHVVMYVGVGEEGRSRTTFIVTHSYRFHYAAMLSNWKYSTDFLIR